jgi:hypothetical protein
VPTGGVACSTLSTDRNNCGLCGNACAVGQDCVSGACQACAPRVTTDTSGGAVAAPSGTHISCFDSGTTFNSVPCPVLVCGARTFWAFSYSDNRTSFDVAGYLSTGALSKQAEYGGGRYLYKITLDAAGQKVNFVGQADGTASVPYSFFQTP